MPTTVPDESRYCAKECYKDGEIHKFAGRVKLVLVEPTEAEEKARNMAASFLAVANIMIGGNLGIITVYALSYKLPLLASAHALLTTVGVQFCLPISVLLLHPLNGPSAPMKTEQRRCEHTFLSIIGAVASFLGCIVLTKVETHYCFEHLHVYGGYALAVFGVISIITGYLVYKDKEELESPFLKTRIHKYFGMFTVLLSAFSYITSLYGEGGCRNTFRLWTYAIGLDAPLYLMYFIVIFYTIVVLFFPGSNFVTRTQYHC